MGLIINVPQIAILGIGAGGTDGQPQMGLSLTFDHRAVDGAPAAAFLTALCEAIERFER